MSHNLRLSSDEYRHLGIACAIYFAAVVVAVGAVVLLTHQFIPYLCVVAREQLVAVAQISGNVRSEHVPVVHAVGRISGDLVICEPVKLPRMSAVATGGAYVGLADAMRTELL